MEQLRVAVAEGEIDTVVLAFTDMQGRLQGKRLSAEFFLEEVAEHFSEGCNYLLAVDVDMNTVDGYAMSSWERGYGDFVMVPDMDTLRRLPWHPGSALVIADLTWLDGAPVLASPRQILAAQIERLASRGWTALAGTELEFIVYQDSYEQAAARDYRDLTPANQYNVDYSILGTSRIEPLLRRIRNEHGRGRTVRGVGQGRVQPRPARDRVPLRGGGDHLRQPLDLQDRGEGDRGPGREQHHVHGQAERPRGKLLPHPPVAARCVRRGAGDGRGRARTACRKLGEHFLAGQLAAMRELALCYAPNINSYKRYVPGSFAPTSVRWGPDNRTCALRLVGHGPSLRVENRVPGGDVNPYLAVAAMIAAGLHGIDNELPLEPPMTGNAYADDHRARPAHPARRAGPVGEERAGPGGVRRGGGGALRQLRPGRADRLRGRGDRLGAAARLRTPMKSRDRGA